MIEEQKVAALVTGSKLDQKHLKAVLKACVNCEGSGDDCFDAEKNPALAARSSSRAAPMIPDNYIERVIQFAQQGFKDIDFPTYDTDWDSEAYLTVSGQNSNNSVRVTDDFLHAVENDGDWNLTYRARTARSPKTRRRRANCGRRSATPPGPAPIPASSSTPPSTTGTPARPAAKSAPPIRAPNTCSWTIPPAISPR